MKRKNKPQAVIYVPETDTPLTGTFVTSYNGSYAGRIFVILGSTGEGFVLLSDGKRRRIAKPKRKRLSHLSPIGQIDGAAELIRNGNITDGKIRQMINEIRRIRDDETCKSESFKEKKDA